MFTDERRALHASRAGLLFVVVVCAAYAAPGCATYEGDVGQQAGGAALAGATNAGSAGAARAGAPSAGTGGTPNAAGTNAGGAPNTAGGGSGGNPLGGAPAGGAPAGGAPAGGAPAGGAPAGGAPAGGAPAGGAPAGGAPAGGSGGAPPTIDPCARANWKATASNSSLTMTPPQLYNPPTQAIDNNQTTRWSSGVPQAPGLWFLLDLGAVAAKVSQLTMDTNNSNADFPVGYKLELSSNGTTYAQVATGGGAALTTINFTAAPARYLRVTMTGTSTSWWSIHELGLVCAAK